MSASIHYSLQKMNFIASYPLHISFIVVLFALASWRLSRTITDDGFTHVKLRSSCSITEHTTNDTLHYIHNNNTYYHKNDTIPPMNETFLQHVNGTNTTINNTLSIINNTYYPTNDTLPFINNTLSSTNETQIIPHNYTNYTTTDPTPTSTKLHCTFDQLLTGGKWIDANRPAVLDGTGSLLNPLLRGYDYCQVDARQDCRRASSPLFPTRNPLVWQPAEKKCSLHHYTHAEAFSCLRNRHILFIGDSLARNFQQALQCNLLTEPETNVGSRDGYKWEYDSYYPEYNSSIRYFSVTLLQPERILLAVNGETNDEVKKVIIGNVEPGNNPTRQNYITDVIVSTGPWWTPKNFESELGNINHVFSVIDITTNTYVNFRRNSAGENTPRTNYDWSWVFEGGDPVAKIYLELKLKQAIKNILDLVPPHVNIVWRTPDVHHELAHFEPIGLAPQEPYGCQYFKDYGNAHHDVNISIPSMYYQDHVRFIWWLREQLITLTRNTRIEIMDVKDISLGRPDAHPAGRIRYVKGFGEIKDCLHWCLGIDDGVPDSWVLIYLNRLCGKPLKN